MKIVQAAKAAIAAVKTVWTATNLYASTWFQGLVASWSKPSYESLARKAYRNPTSARALRLVSQLAAAVPFVVEEPGEEGEMTTDHEMLRILKRPNPRTSTGVFWDKVVAHVYCGGELFFRRITPDSGPNAGKPTANGASLHLISPGAFQEFVREDGTDMITGYRFLVNGKPKVLTTEECLHVKIYNPEDEDRGLPLLLGAHRALEQMEAADEWNKSIADGGGRLPGWFIPKLEGNQQLNAQQVAESQEIADQAILERRQKHLPMVMNGAFDFKEASMTLRDADFLGLGRDNLRKIAAVIGISPTLLGDEKGTSLTDAGIDSEVRAAYLLTVLPLVEFVLGELNAWLSDLYGGATLTYDPDQIEALGEDINEKYKRDALAAGGPFLSINEVRIANGFEPKEGEEYDRIRRVAVTDLGAGPVRDGDTDGEAGEGQSGDPMAGRAYVGKNGDVHLGGVRAALRERYQTMAN